MSTPPVEHLDEAGLSARPFLAHCPEEPALTVAWRDILFSMDHGDGSADRIRLTAFKGGVVPEFTLSDISGPVLVADADTLLYDTAWDDWRCLTHHDDATGRTVVSVFHAAELAALAASDLSGLTVELISSTVERRPGRVTQLAVVNGGAPVALEPGVAHWLEGFNVTATALGQRLELTASPGGGLGRHPGDCQGEDILVRGVSGAAADRWGDLNLIMKDCFWFSPIDNGLKLNDDCIPCVDCQDILAMYKRLQAIHARASNLKTRQDVLIASHDDFVAQLVLLKAAIDVPDGWLSLDRTSDTNYDVTFRLRTGNKRAEDVRMYIDFGDGDTTPAYVPYSGRTKLPGLADSVEDHSPGYADPSVAPAVADTHPSGYFEANRYASWSWNMSLVRPASGDVEVVWRMEMDVVDEDDAPVGTLVFPGRTFVNGVAVVVVEDSPNFTLDIPVTISP